MSTSGHTSGPSATASDSSREFSSTHKRQLISAFIVCCNEEHNIRRCLDSLRWCDEIVIIDSGSKDRTLAIAREYTDKIFHYDWAGYVQQKRIGLGHCSSDWVLNLDADEELSPELRQEIEEILCGKTHNGINGYYLSRVVFYLGRWWRRGGWYPEYRLRFSRRALTTWGGRDPHEKAIVEGATRRLRGELHHYTYISMNDQISRLNNFSSTAARTMYSAGKRASLWNLFFNPPMRFLKFYFLKRGFREGLPGFIVAALEAYYVFLKYAKLWELDRIDDYKRSSRVSGR